MRFEQSVKTIKKVFKKVDLPKIWKATFQELTEDAKVFVYGPPKSGKSTLALRFGGDMAKIGYKVLYIGAEETNEDGPKYSLTRRIAKLKIEHCNLLIAYEIPSVEKVCTADEPLKSFDCIIIDSMQAMKMTDEDFIKLVEFYSKKMIFIISQVNNKNKSNHTKIEHYVDATLNVKKGIVECYSRYNDNPVFTKLFDRRGIIQELNFDKQEDEQQ